MRETEEDGGRVRRMEGDEEGSREKLFLGCVRKIVKICFFTVYVSSRALTGIWYEKVT